MFGAGKLVSLTPAQLTMLIGEVTSLMMASKVHRAMQIRDIADIILPALNLNQYRLYRTREGQAVALVTWAYFSPEVEAAYVGGRALLSEAERVSGNLLYITDFIAPFGHAKRVIHDLRTHQFPNAQARALRFVEHGKARPGLWQLYGVNYQKPVH